jgi:predicted ribosome quality control (RQC) complex YloA/Tae2 family protein
VLLRVNDAGTAPTHRAIEEAASIAAFYSKARGDKKASVAYTKAKYVKKPKGARPGTVNITNYKTIHIEPCDGRPVSSRITTNKIDN